MGRPQTSLSPKRCGMTARRRRRNLDARMGCPGPSTWSCWGATSSILARARDRGNCFSITRLRRRSGRPSGATRTEEPFRLAPTPPATLAPIYGPLPVRLDYDQPVGPLVDHGSRYQLLDHAADSRPLWECRHGIVIDPAEGEPYTLHRERAPDELRFELERLMTKNLVQLLVWSDSSRRALSREEAQQALADDRNWYAPYELGEDKRRSVAYRLGVTDSGREEIRREHARTQAIDGRLGQRTDLHLYDRSENRMLRRPPVHPN